jgi:signal transduction histidine kinase/ligand-binding sensor domain-containing protein
MKAILILIFGVLSLVDICGRALAADLALRQLNHRVFTPAEGAPTDIYALAQTTDGTLWVAGAFGLKRFDGLKFLSYPAPSDEPLPRLNIASLYATPDGGLWIGFRPAGATFLKSGRVTDYGPQDGMPEGTVAQFARDVDGSIWAAARLGLAHFVNGRWKVEPTQSIPGSPYGIAFDPSGTLWVAAVDGLFVRAHGENQFRQLDKRSYFSPSGTVLSVAQDGTICAASTAGLIHVDARMIPEPVVAIRGVAGGPVLCDRHGKEWAWDSETNSLLRMETAAGASVEKVSVRDESNSLRVLALLEDRERNIWVGANTGLHRFSHSNVVHATMPPCKQDVIESGAIAAGEAGALWVGCDDGPASRVDELRDGAIVSQQLTPRVDIMMRDASGTVWLAGPETLGRIEKGRVISTPLPSLLSGRPAQSLARDADGAIWLSASRRGVYRLFNGEWLAYGGLIELPREYAGVASAQPGGGMWLGYQNNRVAEIHGQKARLYDQRQGLQVGNVLSILPVDGQVWVGGERGLARLDGDRFVSVHSVSGRPFEGISGIVKARNGDYWLNGATGISRIAGAEIERVTRDATQRIPVETFDFLDGVPGSAIQARPTPSAVMTTDGRIWFSMTLGIVSVDAAQMVRNTLPPPVTIWSLTSSSTRYPNHGAKVQLPVHTTSVLIDYTAGSLTVPERVRFRYKLEGSDRDWQDVGARREARYTNLGPGHYRFRVIAANNDGVWNDAGAALAFTIPPAFLQTYWFYGLCVLACFGVLAVAYRARVRQVAAQVRGRLEARLAERERIARELHDTLLQGIQGMIWHFQAATDRIPAGEPARHAMEVSLDRADKLLGESRDRVKNLRPAMRTTDDLALVLAGEGEQFAGLHRAKFRVSVQGTVRDLHPIAREEILMIGREAVGNAFRHASAESIEIEITFGDAMLQLRIRDDGHGISGTTLDAGKPGHFGLIGMRERAKKLGAQLEIWSKPRAGTEVDLRVPAQVAYTPNLIRNRGFRSWLATMRSAAGEQ